MLIKELREKLRDLPDDGRVILTLGIPENPFSGDELLGELDAADADPVSGAIFLSGEGLEG